VVSLSIDDHHNFSKRQVDAATFVAGVGIEGDAHGGVTVQHRSRQAHDADSPNLRQVHLLDTGLLERLRVDGFAVEPGALGENVTLGGVDTSAWSVGSIIELGDDVMLAVTGRRNPAGR
jgi:MOSC domain-containing protein YiiM